MSSYGKNQKKQDKGMIGSPEKNNKTWAYWVYIYIPYKKMRYKKVSNDF